MSSLIESKLNSVNEMELELNNSPKSYGLNLNEKDVNNNNNNKDKVLKHSNSKNTKLHYVSIRGISMISLTINGKERVCLAQISNTLLKRFSYNEIHNRRVALGINCIQCSPIELELLRSAGAMPISSRRCGMITKKEAERLVKSFLDETKPPSLPENFTFEIKHKCGYGCRGTFFPSRYNSSRAKCIKCSSCQSFYSPNKFIFHYHETPNSIFIQSGTINFNSWRRHISLINTNDEQLNNAWEEVKSIFNSGKRKRNQNSSSMNNYSPVSPQASTTSNHQNYDYDNDESFDDEDDFNYQSNEEDAEIEFDTKSILKEEEKLDDKSSQAINLSKKDSMDKSQIKINESSVSLATANNILNNFNSNQPILPLALCNNLARIPCNLPPVPSFLDFFNPLSLASMTNTQPHQYQLNSILQPAAEIFSNFNNNYYLNYLVNDLQKNPLMFQDNLKRENVTMDNGQIQKSRTQLIMFDSHKKILNPNVETSPNPSSLSSYNTYATQSKDDVVKKEQKDAKKKGFFSIAEHFK